MGKILEQAYHRWEKMLKIISDQKIKIKSMINYNSYILDWLELRSLKYQLLVRMW